MKEGEGGAPTKMRLTTGKALPPICPPQLLAPGWSPASMGSPQAPGQKVQGHSTLAHLQMDAEVSGKHTNSPQGTRRQRQETEIHSHSLPQVRTTPAAQLRLPMQEKEEDGGSWLL